MNHDAPEASSDSSVTVVVDVANVMGARADGWWRDRAGAAARLCLEVSDLAARGVPGHEGAAFVLVLEGRSRSAVDLLGVLYHEVRVIRAPGSGDDSIVIEADSLVTSGASCLVVTADRALRRRCEAKGARVVGPSWLLGLI